MSVSLASRYILNGTTQRASKSVAKNLLAENGYCSEISRGLWALLPLGQRVVDRLVRLVEHELEHELHAQKCSMPVIGPRTIWEKTGRWQTMGAELAKVKDRNGKEFCIQPTAEEAFTHVVAQLGGQLKSTALPLLLFQTGDKFRDEMNESLRLGLFRAKEFIMNDLYSFDVDVDAAQRTYAAVNSVYEQIFARRLGLPFWRVAADGNAHGGGGASHEFHIRSPLQEDSVDYCESCRIGWARAGPSSRIDECAANGHSVRKAESSVEVAHTFQLGTKYSETFGLRSHTGKPYEMCCFGIGITRLLPTCADLLVTTDGCLQWPAAIAPFDVAVIASHFSVEPAKKLIHELGGSFEYALLDDRLKESVGRRVIELRKRGIPLIVVVGKGETDDRHEWLTPHTVSGRGELATVQDLKWRLQSMRTFAQ